MARRLVVSIAAALVGSAILLALPAVFYGVTGTIDLHQAWWQTVTASTAPNLTNQDNVSIAAMYTKWLGTGGRSVVLTVATSVLLLATIATAFVRRRGVAHAEALEGSLLLTSIPLLSPQGWDYVFLLATPAVMLLMNYADRLAIPMRVLSGAAVAVAGLSLFDVMGRAAYSAFMATSAVTVCYLVVTAAMLSLRLQRVA
jgi:hypothetical protein